MGTIVSNCDKNAIDPDSPLTKEKSKKLRSSDLITNGKNLLGDDNLLEDLKSNIQKYENSLRVLNNMKKPIDVINNRIAIDAISFMSKISEQDDFQTSEEKYSIDDCIQVQEIFVKLLDNFYFKHSIST